MVNEALKQEVEVEDVLDEVFGEDAEGNNLIPACSSSITNFHRLRSDCMAPSAG